MGVAVADDVAGEFHDGHLHPETETEERDPMGARPADGRDFPFDSPASKASGHEDAVHTVKDLGGITIVYLLGVDPADGYAGVVGHTAVF